MTSTPLSLPSTIINLQLKKKDNTDRRYINIELLSKSLWINSLFCFVTDITNELPINFINESKTFEVKSQKKTFLDGLYVELGLAKKIINWLFSIKKIVLPKICDNIGYILPYFELEYLVSGIKEIKCPQIKKKCNIMENSVFINSLGTFAIFPLSSTIPKLLRIIMNINFYSPYLFLDKNYPQVLGRDGVTTIFDKNDSNLFIKLLNAPQNITLESTYQKIGTLNNKVLMDSFVFQKMINLLHHNENQINYKVYTDELDYASYRQLHHIVDGIPKSIQTIEPINIYSQCKKAISRLKQKKKLLNNNEPKSFVFLTKKIVMESVLLH